MPSPRVQMFSITLTSILKVVGVLVALWVLWLIRDIVLYVFSAFLLAGVMYPLVQRLAEWKIPKGLSVVAFYCLTFGVVALAFVLLIPAILTEARLLLSAYGQSFPWLNAGLDTVSQVVSRPQTPSVIVDEISTWQTQLKGASSVLFGVAGSVVNSLAGFVIVLVLAFYVVVEDSAIKTLFVNLIPGDFHLFATQAIARVIERLGDWMRGQLLLGLIIAILYFVSFVAIGVPYPLLLATFGGLVEFIPYIGPFISLVPAVFLAFTISPLHAFATFLAILIIQQLENNIIVPKVMQHAVGLNPIVSIVAFMVGAQLFGLIGAIFSIPVTTALSVVVGEYNKWEKTRRV